MKKISIILLALLSTFAFFACQKEENKTDKETSRVTIHFGFSDETKATFDQEGIKWAAGDVIRFTDQGKGNVKDVTLSSSDISSDGYSATITGDFYLGNKAVFRHNWSPRNDAEWDYGYMGNYAEGCSFVEWNKLTVTQSAAGQINKNFVLLHSGLTALNPAPGTTDFSVKMEILGTILRVLPYTEAYNDEVIESVTLSSTDRLGGVVTVDYSNGQYRDHKDIGWGPDTFKEYKVSLSSGFALTGVTTREASKGFYFSLPATNTGHEIAGYTITVTTDKADYVFDGSAKTLSLGQNKVRNIYLKLENATRTSKDAVVGSYWFDGNLAGGYSGNSLEYGASAQNIADLGYWVVYTIDDATSEVNAREPKDYPDFYDNTVISIVDQSTSAAPDWLQFGYTASHGNSHLWIQLTENTNASSRVAVITFTYPDKAHHYSLRANEPKKVITVTQEGTAPVAKPTFKYTLSNSGWNESWKASGRSFSFPADGFTRGATDDWLSNSIVIAPDLQKLNAGNSYDAYTAGAAFPTEDVVPYVKQALGLSDTDYTAAAEWITFGVHVEGAQWVIRIDAIAANTGAARTLSGNILNYDGSTYSTYNITQAKSSSFSGGATEEWGNVTALTEVKSWAGGSDAPATVNVTGTSSIEFVVGAKSESWEWANQHFILLGGLTLASTKNYTLSFDVDTDKNLNFTVKLSGWDGTNDVGSWFYRAPSSVVTTAGTTYHFTESFAGSANTNANTLLIIDCGWAAAGTTFTLSNFSLLSE